MSAAVAIRSGAVPSRKAAANGCGKQAKPANGCRTMLDKAEAAWGEKMPSWVRTLATVCAGMSVRKVAVRLDVSPAIISLAIGKKRENLDFIRERVEQLLMVSRQLCPVLGEIHGDKCLQEQARPFSSANPLRIQVYRACRNGCPHYREKKT